MFEKLLEQAKMQLAPELINDPEVDNAQAEDIARVTGETIVNNLSSQAQSGNLSGIMEMLSGQDTPGDNSAAQEQVPSVIENLTSKLGISPALAGKIAKYAVPVIMNMLNGKVKNAQSGGLDIGGMLGGVLGGGGKSGGGGLLGKLGSLFGGGKKSSQQQGDSSSVINDILGKIL